jgi:MFS transporter, MHS family, proline/betaine transporter
MLIVVLWFSLVKSAYSGILPSLMADLFPTETRSTGLSLSRADFWWFCTIYSCFAY